MAATEIASMVIPGAGASKATKAADVAGDIADGAGPSVRAAGVVDNAVTDTASIAGRAEGITEKLDDLGDNLAPNASPNATGPAIPRDLAEPPGIGDAPTPVPRAPDTPPPHVPDSTPSDRTPVAPHNSAPTEAPRAPFDAGPPIDRTPAPAHSPAPAATSAQSADVPAGGQNSAPSASASAGPPPTTAARAPELAQVGASPSQVEAAAGHASEPARATTHTPPTAADGSASGRPDSDGATAPDRHTTDAPTSDRPDGPGGINDDGGSDPHDGDPSDGGDNSGTESGDSPKTVKVAGVDYPLPASDALQVVQDPAAELARLADGGVPQSILDGYDPLGGRTFDEFQKEFTIRDSDGNVQWDWENQAPNNGFAGDPTESTSIPENHQLDRLGSNDGGFMADAGAPLADRGMPPGAAAQYNSVEGTGKDVPPGKDWVVLHGPAKSAFGQPGGAEQWVVIDRATGWTVPVDELIEARMIRR
jgi:hypothetical protein